MSSSQLITNKALGYIKTIFENSTQIESLSLDFHLCEKITEVGMKLLQEGLKKLSKAKIIILNLIWCENLNEK